MFSRRIRKLINRSTVLNSSLQTSAMILQSETRQLYLPRSIIADIHVEVLAEWALAAGAVAHPASDQMRRRPHHLRVMADLEDLVRRIRPVLEVLVLHVPHSDGEVPGNIPTRGVMSDPDLRSDVASARCKACAAVVSVCKALVYTSYGSCANSPSALWTCSRARNLILTFSRPRD